MYWISYTACGVEGYYCEILGHCLANGAICRLPNAPPNVPSDLIYVDTIEYYSANVPSDNGRMVGLLLGNASDVGMDSQDEEVSIAIIEASNIATAYGVWQYALCHGDFPTCMTCSDISSWTDIGTVSETAALYLPSTACLRFWRKLVALDGSVWLKAKLWDGNTDGYLSNTTTLVRHQEPHYATTLPYSPTGAISQNFTLFTSLLLPVTDPPGWFLILSHFLQLTKMYHSLIILVSASMI